MSRLEHHTANTKQAVKGAEVFVGGLARTTTENKIHEVFSSCGEIVEIRLIKDQKGNSKGYCFVRYATKYAADKAMKEKSGYVLDGKKIGVLPSAEQDTLFLGNLNKGWRAEEFESIVRQVFSDVASVDLAVPGDVQPGQKHRNRGFGFVKFSSHAAAARAYRVGSTSDFLLGGNLHPSVQWAEVEPEFDPNELAQIKVAFVRLPIGADEDYLKKLFQPFGNVEKVTLSMKGSSTYGFVHFDKRSDLDNAIKALNEKTVQGPNGSPSFKLQVEVAKPMDKNRKRVREDSQSKLSSKIESHSKLLKDDLNVDMSRAHKSIAQLEMDYSDPYEAAIVALPAVVKERLLRIMRLGIANRYDVDIQILARLKELPESAAISILDQFMLSGADMQNKGVYLTGLISKHVDKLGLYQFASMSRIEDVALREPESDSFSARVRLPFLNSYASRAPLPSLRDDVYTSRYSSVFSDPLPSTGLVTTRKMEETRSPLQVTPSSFSTNERVGLDSYTTSTSDRQPSRPRIRFDPFTGEPYKFDPFTGEPILPESSSSHFRSLY